MFLAPRFLCSGILLFAKQYLLEVLGSRLSTKGKISTIFTPLQCTYTEYGKRRILIGQTYERVITMQYQGALKRKDYKAKMFQDPVG
jgi:hypothetical protein